MSIRWNGNKPSSIIWPIMSYVERDLSPINTWTIPSTTTDVVSYSGTNTISLNGKGGHYETCYKSFTVSKSGSYTISYDYDLPTVNFYGTGSSHMHFGIYITTNQPPGGDMGTWSDYSTGNCNGTDICGPSSQYNSPGTGHISFNYTLTAGTTYYLWVPMMNLADGVQTYLTFTNLNVKSAEQYLNLLEPELWYNGSKVWPEELDILDYYPIGTIYKTVSDSFDPNVTFGGTWSKSNFEGRTPIGYNSSLTDLGGELTHTLSISECPSHTHSFGRLVWGPSSNNDTRTTKWSEWVTNNGSYDRIATGSITTNNNSTNGATHNNVQKSKIVHIWERIA